MTSDSLANYTGPRRIRNLLGTFVQAAKEHEESMHHVLLYGSSAAERKTLAAMIANELDVNLRIAEDEDLERPGDVAGVITNLQHGDVLFVNDIHRISPLVEDVLYGAMETFTIDIIIGKGAHAQTVRLDIPPFTLVAGSPSNTLVPQSGRAQFGIELDLDLYSIEELHTLIHQGADDLNITIDGEAVHQIAIQSQQKKDMALTLLRHVHSFAQIDGSLTITEEFTRNVIDELAQTQDNKDSESILKEILLTVSEIRRRQMDLEDQISTIQAELEFICQSQGGSHSSLLRVDDMHPLLFTHPRKPCYLRVVRWWSSVVE